MYMKYRTKYKNLVKKNMKKLEVYKPEFDTLIDVYSGMLAQYIIITERLIEDDFNIEVETERGGTRKSAMATAQEKLRMDIVTYSDRLMLNPKALLNAKMIVGKEESGLVKALKRLEEENHNGRSEKSKP